MSRVDRMKEDMRINVGKDPVMRRSLVNRTVWQKAGVAGAEREAVRSRQRARTSRVSQVEVPQEDAA